MRLKTIGAWCAAFTVASAEAARPAAREIEGLGYETLWYPEGLGTRESFTNASVLLAATDRIGIGSGIANIWARDAVSAANAARVLSDAFDDRFLLGLGVSHPRQVDPRGHRYRRPVATMRAYLDAMDDDPFVSPDGPAVARPPVPRILAALRPPATPVRRPRDARRARRLRVRAVRRAGSRSEAHRDARRGPVVGRLGAGSHNEEVYCGLLGLSDAELGRLREDGVV